MAQDFLVEIFTPERTLLSAQVSQVVLPAFDGECGVMPGHEDFVGLLGTGSLKIIKDNKDYWFMLSSGVFEVAQGRLTILAEVGEEASEINVAQAKTKLTEIEPILAKQSQFSSEFNIIDLEYKQTKARLEVYRRTELAN